MSQITVHNQAELDGALAREDLYLIIIKSPAGVWLTLESNGIGSSSVVARGSSSVEARDSSRVEAWDSSRVEAWGSSRVAARGSSRVVAGAYVAVHLFSQEVQLDGGVIIDMTQLDRKDPQTWCELEGVRVVDGLAHLYKAVDDEWIAGHQWVPTSYEPGSDPVCDQWVGNNSRGQGLHACPSPGAALSHYSDATRFVEVTAPLDSIRPIDSTKCKAPTVHVLREVDIDGEPITTNEKDN